MNYISYAIANAFAWTDGSQAIKLCKQAKKGFVIGLKPLKLSPSAKLNILNTYPTLDGVLQHTDTSWIQLPFLNYTQSS
jgi:hypothetical protein